MIHLKAYFLHLVLIMLYAVCAMGQDQDPIRIGFVGSLSSFAANYGTAVLEGAQLALDELRRDGANIELSVEDDHSTTRDAVTAYHKLRDLHRVRGLIGGSWWVNALVQQTERDKILLLSCETLFDDDTIQGKTSFILQGDLREWLRVYRPVVEQQSWKRGAIIRYVSGFGATLEREMKNLFSENGRSFVGVVEYGDINVPDAADIALKIKRLQPDVVYIDASPAGIGNILKRFVEAGLAKTAIIANTNLDDARRDKLFDVTQFSSLYFTRRIVAEGEFRTAFLKKYRKEPYLNADLGYYATHALVEALRAPDAVATVKQGVVVGGRSIAFDQNNVFTGSALQIFKFDPPGMAVRVQ